MAGAGQGEGRGGDEPFNSGISGLMSSVSLPTPIGETATHPSPDAGSSRLGGVVRLFGDGLDGKGVGK